MGAAMQPLQADPIRYRGYARREFADTVVAVLFLRLAGLAAILVLFGNSVSASAAANGTKTTRCAVASSKPAEPLNLLCGMLQSYLYSRQIFDQPATRLRRTYGFYPPTISDKGRTAWKDLLKRAEAPLRVGAETCMPRRAKLRAQIPRIDQDVLARMCVTVRDYSDLYLVMFVIISERRPAKPVDIAAMNAMLAGIKANFPLLVKALKADPTLTGPV
jgi:hypothetical protein